MKEMIETFEIVCEKGRLTCASSRQRSARRLEARGAGCLQISISTGGLK